MQETQIQDDSRIEGSIKMSNKEKHKELKSLIEKIAAYNGKDLAHRGEWGSINFDDISDDLKTVISLSISLGEMPIQFLADNTANGICDVIKELLPRLEELDKFSITQGDPNSHRTNLANNLHQCCDRFYSQVGMWIPFLAYQRGDVAENIKKLTKAIADTEQQAEAGLARIAQKEKDVDEIVVRTREASADAGVAVFTEDFQSESEGAAKSAAKWLIATIVFAVMTLAIPVAAYFFEDYSGIEKSQLISKLASKVVVISVLLTGTMWCGRIYKSLRHLSILNRHRAIGIKTFRAFSAAASDAQTKDAVLMETTRSIFANASTGLIHESNGDAEPSIIQIAGKVMDTANNK